MNIIQSTLSEYLAVYPQQPIVIAYSGGVDSQVLLHSLCQLKHANRIQNALHVCHVNHGLSEHAVDWQLFAEQQCKQFGVKLTICQVDLARKNQQSLEEIARDARYQALLDTVKQLHFSNALIFTGHHQDDQCETFLLALKRGSGLKGLSAMPTTSTFGEHLLARPLLSCSRTAIKEYATQHHLNWVEDDSNSDTRFDRNFLRQDIIPLLKNRWPSVAATITRSSEHCRDGQLLLDELAHDDLKQCQKPHSRDSLQISKLLELSSLRFNNLLRYFIAQQNHKMPTSEQLKQVAIQLRASSDKSPQVNMSGYSLRRYQDALILTPNFADVSDFSYQFPLAILAKNSVHSVNLPDSLGRLEFSLVDEIEAPKENVMLLQLAATVENITISFSHNNPKCLPQYRQHRRSLKKILQELNIAPWQRKRIPFVSFNEHLVAALGQFICKDFIVTKEISSNQPVLKINWLN